MQVDIALVQDENHRFRLLVDWMRVQNDQSLTMAQVLKMVKTQKITEDLVIELEDFE